MAHDWTRYTRTIAPTDRVISLDSARKQCRIDFEDDDDILLECIDAATAYVEGPNGIGMALLPQTWRLSADALTKNFLIPLCPVIEIESITVGGTAIDASLISVDTDSKPARVSLDVVPRFVGNGQVKIVFRAGYENEADIPADIKGAIRMIVGLLYENREAGMAGGTTMEVTEIPFTVQHILDRYRAFLHA